MTGRCGSDPGQHAERSIRWIELQAANHIGIQPVEFQRTIYLSTDRPPERIANNGIVDASDALVDEFALSFVHLPVRNLLGLLEQTLRKNSRVLDTDDPVAEKCRANITY